MKLHIWITQSNLTQGSYSFERFKFRGFFHDLFKFSIILGLAVTFKNFQNFPCFRVFFYFKQFNRHKLWCPPKCMPLALFNYSSLYYCILHCVLALSSAVTDLSNKTLICHDFRRPKTKFHDFSGLENEILRFHDFPGFPRPVWTLLLKWPPTPRRGELVVAYRRWLLLRIEPRGVSSEKRSRLIYLRDIINLS